MAQQTYTVSFQHGTKVAIGHNRRIESLADKEAHIDPNGKHESWKDEPIEKAYDRIFGEALKEFNNKQKRKDRRIESYLANVRNNSKLHDQYEAIIQVGNFKNHPDEKTAYKILKEYYEDFIKRNGKCLEVIGAFYHADEFGGCPHLHLDYVPKAKGNKTGLKLRNNQTEAFKELGYKSYYVDDLERGINTKTNKPFQKLISAEMQFQDSEREAIASIARKHGFEIMQPKRKPEDYSDSKTLLQTRDIKLQFQQLKYEKKALQAKRKELEKKQKEVEATEKKINKSYKLIKSEHERNVDLWNEYYKKSNELSKREKQVEDFEKLYSVSELSQKFLKEIGLDESVFQGVENSIIQKKSDVLPRFKTLKQNCINLFKIVGQNLRKLKNKIAGYEDRPIHEVITEFQIARNEGFKTYGEYIKASQVETNVAVKKSGRK